MINQTSLLNDCTYRRVQVQYLSHTRLLINTWAKMEGKKAAREEENKEEREGEEEYS